MAKGFRIFISNGASAVGARQAVGKPRGEAVGNLGIGLPIVHRPGGACERSSAERDNHVIHGRAREEGRP
jgi:hypothetical protein